MGATDANRGFDLGAGVPLMRIYPDAEIPVIQVSAQMKPAAARGAAARRIHQGFMYGTLSMAAYLWG